MTTKDQPEPGALPVPMRKTRANAVLDFLTEPRALVPEDGVTILRLLAAERFAIGGASLTLAEAFASADDADLQAAGVIWQPEAVLLAMGAPKTRSIPEVPARLLALSGLRLMKWVKHQLIRVSGVSDAGSRYFAGAGQLRAVRIPHRILWSLAPNGRPNFSQTVAK